MSLNKRGFDVMRYLCLLLFLTFLTACSPPAENAQVEVTRIAPVVQSSAAPDSSPEATPSPSPTNKPSATPANTVTRHVIPKGTNVLFGRVEIVDAIPKGGSR